MTNFVVVAVVRDDVDGRDDIRVVKGRTNAELGSDLLLVLLLALTGALGPELLDGKDRAA